jgi:hypothetical protein
MNDHINFYPWKEIQKKFTDGIILGNGASIAIDEGFSYASLFDNAKKNSLITENVAKVFKHLKTKDFELALRMLWHAYHINRALDIKEDAITSKAYEDLRAALIQSVRDIHVEYGQVSDKLLQMATFLKRFKTVVSLNYDFLVYWAMLVGNSGWNQQWFKDCFVESKFEEDWQWLRTPHGNADGSTLVFYPHGNLVLATDLFGDEHKIARGEPEDLLDKVVHKWESGDYAPLFVSEGTSEQKLQAINRSPYLMSVYKSVLGDLGSRVVIFGWSMRDEDDHILKAICSNDDIKTLAVSVVVSEDEDIESKCTHVERSCGKLKAMLDSKLCFLMQKARSVGRTPNNALESDLEDATRPRRHKASVMPQESLTRGMCARR